MDHKLVNERLNITPHHGKGSNGDQNSKSSQELHLSWNESRVLSKAKLAPQTFTKINSANKSKHVKCGHHIASTDYEITSKDGETGKGIDNATLNNAAKLNNDLKAHQLKRVVWAMLKDALEAGVPGIQDVATHLMKQQFTKLYTMKAPTLPTHDSSHASLADNTIMSSQSDQA
jgi:hypothetical protein